MNLITTIKPIIITNREEIENVQGAINVQAHKDKIAQEIVSALGLPYNVVAEITFELKEE